MPGLLAGLKMLNKANNIVGGGGGMTPGGLLSGFLSTSTLITAFVLSIMVINNYRQCKDKKGYPEKHFFTHTSYMAAVVILIFCCIKFAIDIAMTVGMFAV